MWSIKRKLKDKNKELVGRAENTFGKLQYFDSNIWGWLAENSSTVYIERYLFGHENAI